MVESVVQPTLSMQALMTHGASAFAVVAAQQRSKGDAQMATIAELDGYRFETMHGVMGWYLDSAEKEVEPFVRLVRKSDGAHIDYGLDHDGVARLLWGHVHGSGIDPAWLRNWIANEEKAGKLDWGAEPYWLPARASELVEVDR
jgi:hypothetical protein